MWLTVLIYCIFFFQKKNRIVGWFKNQLKLFFFWISVLCTILVSSIFKYLNKKFHWSDLFFWLDECGRRLLYGKCYIMLIENKSIYAIRCPNTMIPDTMIWNSLICFNRVNRHLDYEFWMCRNIISCMYLSIIYWSLLNTSIVIISHTMHS